MTNDLINWSELFRSLGFSRKTYYSKKLPKSIEHEIKELKGFHKSWVEKVKNKLGKSSK